MTYQLESLMELAWDQLWQVTIVAIIVATLVGIIGRKRPHLAYLLWMLVIAKCLTPPLWSSPTGLFSWARIETHQIASALPELVADKDIAVDNSSGANGVSTVSTLDQNDGIGTEPIHSQAVKAEVMPKPARDTSHDSAAVRELRSRAAPITRSTISWPIGIAIAWGCGAADEQNP